MLSKHYSKEGQVCAAVSRALTRQSSTVMVTPPSVLSALVRTSKNRPLYVEHIHSHVTKLKVM